MLTNIKGKYLPIPIFGADKFMHDFLFRKNFLGPRQAALVCLAAAVMKDGGWRACSWAAGTGTQWRWFGGAIGGGGGASEGW